jgi:hypothetical protein
MSMAIMRSLYLLRPARQPRTRAEAADDVALAPLAPPRLLALRAELLTVLRS